MSPCEYMLTLKFNQQGICGQTWNGIPIKNLKMNFQLWGGSFCNLKMNGFFYNSCLWEVSSFFFVSWTLWAKNEKYKWFLVWHVLVRKPSKLNDVSVHLG
jgi:hypothetical protein